MDGRNKFMAAGLEAVERVLEQQGQQQQAREEEEEAPAAATADEFVGEADELVGEADDDVTHQRTSYRPSPAPSHRTTPAPSPTTHAAFTGADLPPRVPSAGEASPARAPSHASSYAPYPQDAGTASFAFVRGPSAASEGSTGSAGKRASKRTPSPCLFKNLLQKAQTEKELFLQSSLPLDKAVPLLQGVVRRLAVARVASYWCVCVCVWGGGG